jgi:hypothetical protein
VNGAQVFRYEKRHRLPPLEPALACEEIFEVPAGGLFARVTQAVGRDIEKRRVELLARLQTKTPSAHDARLTAHKLRSPDDRERPMVAKLRRQIGQDLARRK